MDGASLAAPVEERPLSFAGRQLHRARTAVAVAFGFATMIALLAVLAAIPGVQLLSLGYLLEAEGRVGRSGRLRGALPGLLPLARIGGAALGLLVVFSPWLLVRDLRHDAILIDPASHAARSLAIWSNVLLAAASVHAVLALLRGGRLGMFLRPIKNLRASVARIASGEGLGTDRALRAVRSLELGHYFFLGLKGFAAALIWIAVPTLLLSLARRAPPLALLGGVLLALLVVPLPLLQARLAAENRFRAGFELGEVWRRYRRAPLASLAALVLTVGLAIPLYVLKIELIPRDARVLAAAVFLVTILPTKLAAGKAYARGGREGRAFFPFRFVAAVLGIAVAAAYVGVVFLTRFIEWRGASGLFEQHAFLVPVAFY